MSLEDVLATHDLSRRPSRAPRYEPENRALLALAPCLSVGPHQLFEGLAGAALELCAAESAGITSVVPGHAGAVPCHAVVGRLAPQLAGRGRQRGGPIGIALESKRPLLFVRPERHFHRLRKLGIPITEALVVPFGVDGTAVGAIWVASHGPGRPFDMEDERVLSDLARFAAEASRSAGGLFAGGRATDRSEPRPEGERWVVGRLDALSTRLVTSSNPASALDEVLDAAIELQSADMGTVQLYDEERHTLELVAHRGMCAEFVEHFRHVGVESGSACGRALRTRSSVVVADVERDSEFAAHLEVARLAGFAAVQSTPLRSPGGAVLGVISTHFRRPHRPSNHEIRMLELYAYHAVGLLEAMRAQEALRDAVRRKDDFLAMLGHELRNPLAPMLTALELLRMRGSASHEQDVLERQVHHLSRMVEDLLDVSRITRGKIELRRHPMEIGDAVRSGLDQAGPLVERRMHVVDVDVPSGLGVDADPDRLAQVVANLVTNAAKFSEPGSRIAVTATRIDGQVRLEVRDDGMGIPADMLPTLFDAFVQRPQSIERSQGGLGLGLAIVRSLVALHGGTIQADSLGAGHGSTFILELPAVDLAAPRSPAGATAMRCAPDRGMRVLVVDDNEDAADVLRVALSTLGYDVEIAHDGPSAIEVARRFQPELALLDIGLPVMDGYELAPHLRAVRNGGLRLVAVTGYGLLSDHERSRRAGFERHLVKPVDLGRLQEVIESGSTSRA